MNTYHVAAADARKLAPLSLAVVRQAKLDVFLQGESPCRGVLKEE